MTIIISLNVALCKLKINNVWIYLTYSHKLYVFSCLQTEQVYIMDVNVMTKICNGNFYYDRKKMITVSDQ